MTRDDRKGRLEVVRQPGSHVERLRSKQGGDEDASGDDPAGRVWK